jgi:Zn-dependent protease
VEAPAARHGLRGAVLEYIPDMPRFLAMTSVNWSSPLFWAVIIGWIISVTLHELGHGVVAYLGGDYTIRQRGGLTLNPLHYAHPVTTFLLPALFVLMGAVPLVGAATYINVRLLRSRAWRSATAAAGPTVNLLLFLLCVLPLHPKVGWLDRLAPQSAGTSLQMFCGAMGVLQLIAVFINLLPIPPLDGFNVIEPWIITDWRVGFQNVQARMGLLILLFFLLMSRAASNLMYDGVFRVLHWLGFDIPTWEFIRRSYNLALYGATD